MLNIGFLLATTAALLAFIPEAAEADEKRRRRKLTRDEWVKLWVGVLATLGTALGSFGVSTLGAGWTAYIPTMALAPVLLGALCYFHSMGIRVGAAQHRDGETDEEQAHENGPSSV